MSEDINNLLGIIPKGEMSTSRSGFPNHGSCQSIAHQFFSFCDPPSRQLHAGYVNSKSDCASGPTPFRKNAWQTSGPQDSLNITFDHSRSAQATTVPIKSNSAASTTVAISQIQAHPDPYHCCKTASTAAAWEAYHYASSGAPGGGRLLRPPAGLPNVLTSGSHPHMHPYYPPSIGVMVPLPMAPGAVRPPIAPRHAASITPRPPTQAQAQASAGMPPPPPSTHPPPGQPHQPIPAPNAMPTTSVGTPAVAYPTIEPPTTVWPWTWSQSQQMPQHMSSTTPVPGHQQASATAGGNGSGGWTLPPVAPGSCIVVPSASACRSGGGTNGGVWRLDDDEAEDALQELLLEEIAAAPWPHVHFPSLRAAGVYIESYHGGRCEPSMLPPPPWLMPPAGGPLLQMAPWMSSSAITAGAVAGKQVAPWDVVQMSPPPGSEPHPLQQQISASASSLPPMAPPLPPQLPPQPKHWMQSQSSINPQQQQQQQHQPDQTEQLPSSAPLLLPQPPTQSAPNSLLLSNSMSVGATGIMDTDLGLPSRNDDALFVSWLSEMGTGSGRDGFSGGGAVTALQQLPPGSIDTGAASSWPPQVASTGVIAPIPVTTGAVGQQDSGYHRASFVNSPNSASMPTTPTVTNGRPRSETNCGGCFTLSASASVAAAVPSQAAAAAAAAVSAAVAVVAAVEAAADAADVAAATAVAAAACGGSGDDGEGRDDDGMISEDGEAETTSGELNSAQLSPVNIAAPVNCNGGGSTAAVTVTLANVGHHAVITNLREQIYRTFDLPVADAARVLGISATELKRRCRRLGISRWPQRKLQSLRRIVESAEVDSSLTEEERKAVMELAARNRDEIMADPDAPLVDLLKTVRQTQYKQSFEKRAAVAAANRRAPGH